LLQKQLEADDAAGPLIPEEGWTEHQSGDGRRFYHHKDTGLSSWEKPEELMTEEEKHNDTKWREYRIWDGRAFFYNKETKVSCWSMPPEMRKLRGESTGVDDRPVPQTQAEKRKLFWDLMIEKGIDDAWSWSAAMEALRDEPLAMGITEAERKQCFAELVGYYMQKKHIEARQKERSGRAAFEKMIERAFGSPEAADTTYEEAKAKLQHHEAWFAIKSDLRRDEVFQGLMERLEEQHRKARAESRHDRVVRLQRRLASDPELKRQRLRWKDVAALLTRKGEMQDLENPPLEAIRVWSSLKDLKPSVDFENEGRSKSSGPETAKAIREDRKRREAFVLWLKDLALRSVITTETPWWSEFEKLAENDPRYVSLQEGTGATAMELYDEFMQDLEARGPEAVLGGLPKPREVEDGKFEGKDEDEEDEAGPAAKRQRLAAPGEEARSTQAQAKEEDDDDDDPFAEVVERATAGRPVA